MPIHSRLAGVTILLLLCAALPAQAADAEFKIPGGGTMRIPLAKNWEDHSIPSPDDKHPPLIKFELPFDQGSLQITPIPPGKTVATDDDLKKAANAIGQQYAAGSVEKKAIVEEIRKGDTIGYACSFTDAAPKKGADFKSVTAGVVRVDKQVIAFTLLYNGKKDPARGDGLEMVTGIMIGSAKPGPAVVTSPDQAWTLTVGGKWKINQVNSDKKSHNKAIEATDEDGGWVLSIYMSPPPKQANAAEAASAAVAREYYQGRLKKSPLPIADGTTATIGDAAVAEYTIKYGNGQKNANAYLAHDGYWIDVHVSKLTYDEAKDRATLDEMLKSIKIEKPAAKDAKEKDKK